MKKPLFYFLLCLVICSLVSPIFSQSLPKPSSLFKRQITFGSGGGVAGAMRSYTLYENGQVFLKESLSDSLKLHKTLNDFQTKDAFLCADQLKLNKYNFNHPGNLYYFVEYNNPKKKYTAKVSWGSTRYKVSKSTQKFYTKLMKMMNN